MVSDFPDVSEVFVDGDDDSWRPTTVTVGFEGDAGRGTGEVATIMRRCGSRLDYVVWGNFSLER